MTARRLAHDLRPTIGPDRRDVYETPCLGSWQVYDALLEKNVDTVRYAREAAIAMCATCPIQPQCFRDNRDEAWVKVLSGDRPPSLRDWGRGEAA